MVIKNNSSLLTKTYLGNCLDVLKTLPDNSVDSIVTDPPYGLSFMGKKWDYDVPSKEIWIECLRVLKYGGHLLAFGGTRTYHRLVVEIEDAGFDIRDTIQWIYGSGFPKSMNISKAIDKAAGAKREVVGRNPNSREKCDKSNTLYESGTVGKTDYITKPATPEAEQWGGWGTALKPANEPICLARKPLKEKTIVKNVLKYNTGAINIDDSRIFTEDVLSIGSNNRTNATINYGMKDNKQAQGQHELGRFPANVILDEEAGAMLDEQSGISASRFFYCAKAHKKEKNLGLDNNFHPTVKPVKLMRYLCRLITPTNGTILDPFMGSGTTGIGAMLEGFDFIGIEMEEEYLKIAEARIEAWKNSDR
tara:strand:+ start:6303 stop:7391 length:1089 start_codon:yes stop_codon:yes gene_type:complete